MEKKYLTDDEAIEKLILTGQRMYERGFVAGSDGNLSIRVDDDKLWITMSGISKGHMDKDSFVKVDFKGNKLFGKGKSSSETMMHIKCYETDDTVRGVVHAHSPYGTAFACAGLPLDARNVAEGILQFGIVPCTEFAMPGTEDLAMSIIPYIKDNNALLLGNHGVLTWGEDILKAYMKLEALEFYAREIMLTRYVIGKERLFSDEDVDTLMEIGRKMGSKQGGRPS